MRLRPRAMDVLTVLALAPGELVSKRDLIDGVWRTEFVGEHALTQVIAELRAALGDNARNPSFIENIPRRGYRLVAAVMPVAVSSVSSNGATMPFKLVTDDGSRPLMQGSTVIGRTDDADICIDKTEVSRCHAMITVQGTTAIIEDLGSKNGTFVNGHQVGGPTPLTNGDEIWIGRSVSRMRFLIEGEPTKTEASVT
ncbi:MAG: FHA domain-containing protein [Thermoanaerobaculales bacterium]|nr:FHA domain-containing protein [Thermoanaerobaculales bacterium]